MATSKRLRITLAVVAFLVANAIVYLGVSKRRVAVVPPDPYAAHPHVQRVAAKIDQIGAKAFDDLVNDITDRWVAEYSGVNLASTLRGRDLALTLANRNTRRLAFEIQKLSPEKRLESCRRIFKSHLERHRLQLDRVLQALEDGTAEGSHEAQENQLAICNSLYLTSLNCRLDVLAAQLAELIELRKSVSERLQTIKGAPPSVLSLMPQSVCPDDEFVISVVWNHVTTVLPQSEGGKSTKRFLSELIEKQIITTEVVTVVPWNARIDWYDCVILKIDGHSLKEGNPYTAVYWDRCKSREKGRIMADLMSRLH